MKDFYVGHKVTILNARLSHLGFGEMERPGLNQIPSLFMISEAASSGVRFSVSIVMSAIS